jgi:predicted amidohydrolase
MNALTVAAAQIACSPGEIDANLARHLAAIAAARARDVALLLFPELSLTDYLIAPDCELLARSAESWEVAELARAAQGIALSFGFIERAADGGFHNAQALVSEGKLLHVHRKANLPTYGRLREGDVYRAGRSIAPAPWRDRWSLATLICADAWNPALAWLAALEGADTLLVPAASALGVVDGGFDNPSAWDVVLRHTAMSYGLPMIFANHCGRRGPFEFWGGSRVIDAFGVELARVGGEEELVVARIDRADAAAARARLPTIRDADPILVAAELERILTERRR